MAEVVDAADFLGTRWLSHGVSTHTQDQKSAGGDIVPVRVRSGAPEVHQDKVERRILFSILSDI